MIPFRTPASFEERSVFTPDALIREARRKKRLDADGEIARSLHASGQVRGDTAWPCCHTERDCPETSLSAATTAQPVQPAATDRRT